MGPKEDKLGIRGSDTHTLQFNDVKVPKENRIGEDGFGFKFAMKTLSGGRIGIAEDMAGVSIFLSSKASSYITGTIIPVDGGSLIARRHME